MTCVGWTESMKPIHCIPNQGTESHNWKRWSNPWSLATTLRRPVQLIYPLRVSESETQEESKTVEDTEEPKLDEERDKPKLPKRPKQDSALRACDHVKTWTR